MPDTKPWTVLWTTQALQNAESIKDYLNKNFSQKEIDVLFVAKYFRRNHFPIPSIVSCN